MSTDKIDRGVALHTLAAGVVCVLLCILTSQFGFVHDLGFVLAPSLVLLGIAGLVDPRTLRAALRKPGETVDCPRWATVIGYACWTPSVLLLGYLVYFKLIRR